MHDMNKGQKNLATASTAHNKSVKGSGKKSYSSHTALATQGGVATKPKKAL